MDNQHVSQRSGGSAYKNGTLLGKGVKIEVTDNQHVSQRSGCSTHENGTLWHNERVNLVQD